MLKKEFFLELVCQMLVLLHLSDFIKIVLLFYFNVATTITGLLSPTSSGWISTKYLFDKE